MTITNNFLKTYADKTYKHAAMVRHKGKIVALAMDDLRHIYYSVLNLDNTDDAKSPLDVHYWLENPKPIRFSNEIVQVGYGVVDPVKMPVVKKGSRAEAEPGTLRPEEIDPFLSTTARFTADAPFDALSDGKYIYIFRQSIDVQYEDIVYARNADGSPVVDGDGNKVPLVNDTLLVDRFVLAGTELQPKREVRYKRSRNKYRPQSNKDSLGAQDMEKKPFFEPTQELDFVKNLRDGRFSVLLLPTQIAGIQRWQIFTHNSQTGQIDSFNVERAADLLFNTKGTQYYTSPDPQYQKSVFERQPGTCPFTGEDLIPLGNHSGIRRSSFEFDERTIESGISTILYHQQHKQATGYDQQEKPVKRNACMMLAVATTDPNDEEARQYISILDFAISREGQLAQVPEKIELPEIVAPTQEQQDAQIALPMSLLHTDSLGLPVSGGLLDFAWTRDTPLLSESATGQLGLYFRGIENQFFAAYYDTHVSPDKPCQWVAQSPGKALTFDGDDDYVGLPPKSGLEEQQKSKPSGSALAFDGRRDKVDVPYKAELNPKEFTIEVWAKVTGGSGYMSPLTSRGDYPQRGYIFYANAHSQTWEFWLGIGHRYEALVGSKYAPGTWTHLAGTYSSQSEQMRLYINGELAGSLDGLKYSPNTQYPLRIGAGATEGSGNFYFPGEVDEVRVWNRVRSQTDIKNQMNQRLLGNEPGIVGYWRFEVEGVQDYSGYGNHGTLSGRPQEVPPPESLTGSAQPTSTVDLSKLAKFDAQNNLTLEAWIQPGSGGGNITRIIHHHSRVSAYTLGVQAKAINSAFAFDGARDKVDVPYKAELNPKEFTIEVWAKVTGGSGHMSPLTSRNDGPQQGYIFYANAGKWAFWLGVGHKWIGIAGGSYEQGIWAHLAGTYNPKSEQMDFYVNGELVASQSDVKFSPNTKCPLRIGAGATERSGDYYFHGEVDEVRVWNQVRTQANIQADMNRQLTGQETGLVGYWHFEDGAKDYSPNGNHGNPYSSPWNVASPLKAPYTLFAGVGEQFKQTQQSITFGQWEHIAAVYYQSYALEFKGDDALSCDHNTTLDIARDLTVEVFLKLENFTQLQGIVTKGHLSDGTQESVTYALYVETDGKIVFAFEDKDGSRHEYKSSQALKAGAFQKIALTRQHKIEVPTSQDRGVKQWTEIDFYLEQNPAGSHTYHGEDAGSNTLPLEIGKTYSYGQEHYLEGIISEIRLWNQALPPENICRRVQGNEEGLVSWWRLEEKEGNIAYDAKSNNHAIVKGAQWTKNPDPTASMLLLYRNGSPIETEEMEQKPSWGEEQFSLGASKNRGLQECFSGTLEEIRIWKVSRTQEQIQDNLFTRLKGEKEDLIAYYTFDLENETELSDRSLLGNHLAFGIGSNQPTEVISTAPVSNDIAQVQSALARVSTQFHDIIHSRPAVGEYGDLQYDIDGNLTGVHKRCYGYIKNGQWHLLTGYKVGNLVTEWIAQVQADPQIIGYIEGAPPVPSENLTATSMKLGEFEDYNGCSSVELEEAEAVNYVYAASKEEGFDTAIETSLATGVDVEVGAGFGVTTKIADINCTAGVRNTLEFSNSQLSESSVSYGRNATKTSRLELRGSWDQAGSEINPAVGRRFVPANTGFALVQSDTMDVFALRLAHNNALVSYRMQPNPDIPKDWNIITFPLNNTYTKQGTLDGKVGVKEDGSVQCDPDYANASTYGQHSYFKPIEAYTLKKKIEREQQELQTYYQSYGVDAGGNTSSDEIPKSLAARNLVNTYVWTADGGFFSESTEVMESVQESTTGSYSFAGAMGATIDMGISAGSVGMEFSMDALFGSHVETVKTKGKETEKSFGLTVEVEPECDIQLYVNTDAERKKYQGRINEGGGAYDEEGNPVLRPGKVDAYRFMSFYLEPAKENFEDFFNKVVDPIWLEQSDAPNAVALRQAHQGDKKPKCWRIMHRVTFVSRVLPEIEAPNAPPMEKAIRKVNIESNYELIKKLEPFVKNKTQDYAIFAEAVRETLKTNLPELQPHEASIIEYAALYFGVVQE